MVDAKNLFKWILWIAGFMIIFGTHILLIGLGELPPNMIMAHSIANMIAAVLIIIGNTL